jgi:hypothetical protein
MLRTKGKATDERDILMSSMRSKKDEFLKDRNIVDGEIRDSYVKTITEMRTARGTAPSGKGSSTLRAMSGFTPVNN